MSTDRFDFAVVAVAGGSFSTGAGAGIDASIFGAGTDVAAVELATDQVVVELQILLQRANRTKFVSACLRAPCAIWNALVVRQLQDASGDRG